MSEESSMETPVEDQGLRAIEDGNPEVGESAVGEPVSYGPLALTSSATSSPERANPFWSERATSEMQLIGL